MIQELPTHCCPHCHSEFVLKVHESVDDRILSGELICRNCDLSTPVLRGFPMFSETMGRKQAGANRLQQLSAQLAESKSRYRDLVRRQSRRPMFDPYSAYFPFNEALQGFLRLVGLTRRFLRPGDLVLDLNCRTGWTGELLASMFPEQKIVSLWEGNQGLLGYAGYDHWLPGSQRAQNLEIVFHPHKHKMPFRDNTFNLVFGFDFLHHHCDPDTLEELLRISTPTCPLLFPHVHTNHSVPDPHFERGGTLLSSSDWCRLLSRLRGNIHRQPCVISELEIFEDQSFRIETKPDITHYNCFVMLVPESWIGRKIYSRGHEPCSGKGRLFTNPLLRIDLNTGFLAVDPDGMDGGVRHLLARHPAIEADLMPRLSPVLTRDERSMIYWGQKGLTCEQICAKLGCDLQTLNSGMRALAARRIALAVAVSEKMWALQHFCLNRYAVQPVSNHHFPFLWRNLDERYRDHPVAINNDGSEFGVEHTRMFVNATRALFAAKGIGYGDHIVISSGNHLEVLITCWAAWLSGIIVVVVRPDTEPQDVQSLAAGLDARLVFSDKIGQGEAGYDIVVYDDPDSETTSDSSFSAQIEQYFEKSTAAELRVDQESPALILSTSGSSGVPKRVILSHGSLFRSGESLARIYQWGRGERMMSLGPMYSMSGLRNPAIAALHSGTTIVVASTHQQRIFAGALLAIEQFSVNVVTTVPAFVDNLLGWVEQGRTFSASSVRLILSTAENLDSIAQQRIRDRLGIEVLDYYGLTETGGVCMLQRPGRRYATGCLGTTENCIVEIRSRGNLSVQTGSTGELYIYSDNLMQGYLGGSNYGLRLKDGWLATGDRGRILETGEIVFVGRIDGSKKNRQGEFIAADASQEQG